MKNESYHKRAIKANIANYQQMLKDFRRVKSNYQLQVKLCDKNIKTCQDFIKKLRLELKQEA